MKHRALIVSSIVNLEQKLDATLHFGESMNDRQTSHRGMRTAAKIAAGAGALGLVGTAALHGHGYSLRKAAFQGAKKGKGIAPPHFTDVRGNVGHGARDIQERAKQAASYVNEGAQKSAEHIKRKAGEVREKVAARFRKQDGDHRTEAAMRTGMAAADRAIELAARIDRVINFDDNGPWSTTGKVATAGAATGAAGLAGLYGVGALQKRKALKAAMAGGDPDEIAAAKKAAGLGNVGSHIASGYDAAAKKGARLLVSHLMSARVNPTQFDRKEDKYSNAKRTGAALLVGTAAGVLGHKYGPGLARSAVTGVKAIPGGVRAGFNRSVATKKDAIDKLNKIAKKIVEKQREKERGRSPGAAMAHSHMMSAQVNPTQFTMDTNGGTKPMVQKQKNPQKSHLLRNTAAAGAAAGGTAAGALYLRGRLGNGGGTKTASQNVVRGAKSAAGDMKKLGHDVKKVTIATGKAAHAKGQSIIQNVAGKIKKLAAKKV